MNTSVTIINKRDLGRNPASFSLLNFLPTAGAKRSPQKKYSETRDLKRVFHLPGKKKYSAPQIFETSDRISYGFNKLVPFSVNSKKSISDAITEAHQKKVKDMDVRKFIKANNYYLHNFLVANQQGNNTMVRFRLNEILKEKRQLKARMISQLAAQRGKTIFLDVNCEVFKPTVEKKISSSPVKLMKSAKSEIKFKSCLTRITSIPDIESSNKRLGKDYHLTRIDTINESKLQKRMQEAALKSKLGKEETAANEYIFKCAMKSIRNDRPHGIFLENSLAHINSMNSQMKLAGRIIKFKPKHEL